MPPSITCSQSPYCQSVMTYLVLSPCSQVPPYCHSYDHTQYCHPAFTLLLQLRPTQYCHPLATAEHSTVTLQSHSPLCHSTFGQISPCCHPVTAVIIILSSCPSLLPVYCHPVVNYHHAVCHLAAADMILILSSGSCSPSPPYCHPAVNYC